MDRPWTPGEWELREVGRAITVCAPRFPDKPEWLTKQRVATMSVRRDSTLVNEGRANATLIAASPDLFEALEECLDIARRNESGDYVRRAVAALNKALGKE